MKSNPVGQSCSLSAGSGTVASANVTSVAVACSDTSVASGSDDFNRADGGLGANWTAVSGWRVVDLVAGGARLERDGG